MTLGDLTQPPGPLASARFTLVGYLPTAAATLFVLGLVWAGAPGDRIRFKDTWQTASRLTVGEVVVLALFVAVVAVLLQPLQQVLVRWLEGYWPGWLARLPVRFARWRQRRAVERAVPRLPAPDPPDAPAPPAAAALLLPTDAERIRAGRAGQDLRSRYPLPVDLVRPTALGNALAAMEDRAGRDYGLDAVVAWPRLYPILRPELRALVDDRRDALDLACRLVWVGLALAVTTLVLLWQAGWWPLLALAPLTVAALAYRGAVRIAAAYGELVDVAFDTHRTELRALMHLAAPRNLADERDTNRALCDFWRQSVPMTHLYAAPAAER